MATRASAAVTGDGHCDHRDDGLCGEPTKDLFEWTGEEIRIRKVGPCPNETDPSQAAESRPTRCPTQAQRRLRSGFDQRSLADRGRRRAGRSSERLGPDADGSAGAASTAAAARSRSADSSASRRRRSASTRSTSIRSTSTRSASAAAAARAASAASCSTRSRSRRSASAARIGLGKALALGLGRRLRFRFLGFALDSRLLDAFGFGCPLSLGGDAIMLGCLGTSKRRRYRRVVRLGRLNALCCRPHWRVGSDVEQPAVGDAHEQDRRPPLDVVLVGVDRLARLGDRRVDRLGRPRAPSRTRQRTRSPPGR